MREHSCKQIVCRPNGRGYGVTRNAALALGLAAGVTTYAGYEPSILWTCVTFILLGIGVALISATLIVGADRVALMVFGTTIAFRAEEIERDRFDELAFMNISQVSSRHGRLLVIPRGAFSNTAPFDAIVALTNGQAAERGEDPAATRAADGIG